MAQTDTATLTEVIMKYYARKLLKMLRPMLVLHEDAVKKPLPPQSGTTVMWTRFKQFAGPELLSEGTSPTAAALSAENVSTKIFQLGKHTLLTDLIETTAIDPIVEDAIENISLAARKGVDSAYGRLILWRKTSMSATLGLGGAGVGFGLSGSLECLSAAQLQIPLIRNGSGACSVLAVSGIHSSSTLTVTLLRQARKHLEARDAPKFPDGTYHGVSQPDALNVLTGTSGWIDFNKYTNVKPITGELGKIQNIRFKGSTNMPTIESAGARVSAHGGGTVHITYIYGPGAYGVTQIQNLKGRENGAELIIKHSNANTMSQPLNQIKSSIGWKFTGAVKVLNNSCIIGILTGKGDDSLVAA